jgi:hypothetical protein
MDFREGGGGVPVLEGQEMIPGLLMLTSELADAGRIIPPLLEPVRVSLDEFRRFDRVGGSGQYC